MPDEYVIGSLDEETGEIDGWFNIPEDMFRRIEKMYDILSKSRKNINEKCKFGVYKLVDTEEGLVVDYSHKISEKFYRQLKYKAEHGKPMLRIKI